MKKEIILTKDGSTSIFLPELNETYHSKFGAIQEANHVFIKNGLSLINDKSVFILEIGFGTGLNAFITFLEAIKTNQTINYVGVEAFPVELDVVKELNYVSELEAIQYQAIFNEMHQSKWEIENEITSNFNLTKREQKFEDISDSEKFNLIYFDAFGFDVQPELWNEEIFQKMYDAMLPNGVLVTYACRTTIKNAMKQAGFKVEKLPGAPGKREMLRAIKD
ncbi:tRNA (5-methylaminomethyl-2-thiouridine)(34)-methyltransferase MnmD [uncultured Flavobacterium sp.]|uniref:tRNA (5-methylaminomethyl-2-thiouridine)(34)-methyltransferase MnmD n=1 Tax=uncultured Flavobacterium sp. TaxID=165435 RepID=UPI0030ED5600